MAERIGDILVRRGACRPQEITQALLWQQGNPGRLCGHLLALNLCQERMLAEALAEQQGIPAVVLSQSVLPRGLVGMIPLEVCRGEGLLPLGLDEVTVTVAFSGPPSARLMTEISFASGRRVLAVAAVDAALQQMVSLAEMLPDGALVCGTAVPPGVALPPGGHVEWVRPPAPALPLTSSKASPGELAEGGWPEERTAVSTRPVRPTLTRPSTSGVLPAVTSPPQRRVLVVDDVAELRTMVRRVLELDGYALAEAGTGYEAIRLIQAFSPELIVLDAMLPEVHGFEISRALKQSPVYKSIPIVMMSAIYKGWDYARDIQEVYGVDVFFEKPFDVNLLRERVRLLLASAPAQGAAVWPDLSKQVRDEAQDFLSRGELDAALQSCERGLRLDPFDAQLMALKAMAYERQGHVQHAIVGYERALELMPDNFVLHRNLALLYEQQGFRRRASLSWQRAMELCREPDLKERIRMRLMMGLQA